MKKFILLFSATVIITSSCNNNNTQPSVTDSTTTAAQITDNTVADIKQLTDFLKNTKSLRKRLMFLLINLPQLPESKALLYTLILKTLLPKTALYLEVVFI